MDPLEQYVKACIARGYSRGDVAAALDAAKWKKEDYKGALDKFFPQASPYSLKPDYSPAALNSEDPANIESRHIFTPEYPRTGYSPENQAQSNSVQTTDVISPSVASSLAQPEKNPPSAKPVFTGSTQKNSAIKAAAPKPTSAGQNAAGINFNPSGAAANGADLHQSIKKEPMAELLKKNWYWIFAIPLAGAAFSLFFNGGLWPESVAVWSAGFAALSAAFMIYGRTGTPDEITLDAAGAGLKVFDNMSKKYYDLKWDDVVEIGRLRYDKFTQLSMNIAAIDKNAPVIYGAITNATAYIFTVLSGNSEQFDALVASKGKQSQAAIPAKKFSFELRDRKQPFEKRLLSFIPIIIAAIIVMAFCGGLIFLSRTLVEGGFDPLKNALPQVSDLPQTFRLYEESNVKGLNGTELRGFGRSYLYSGTGDIKTNGLPFKIEILAMELNDDSAAYTWIDDSYAVSSKRKSGDDMGTETSQIVTYANAGWSHLPIGDKSYSLELKSTAHLEKGIAHVQQYSILGVSGKRAFRINLIGYETSDFSAYKSIAEDLAKKTLEKLPTE